MGEEKMTIKTLELIHDMLEHELDAVRNEVRVIRKGLNEKYPEDWDKKRSLIHNLFKRQGEGGQSTVRARRVRASGLLRNDGGIKNV